MVEDKVKDIFNLVWALVLLLTERKEIVCAPSIHKSCLPYLQQTIDEYLSLRAIQFPNVNLRPRHHYVWHYPE